jgi:2-dehydropantoate 2-reductase
MNQIIKPRIAVVGAGAIGSIVGGLLAHAGQDVTLIARRAHVEAINKNGLFVDGILGEFTVSVKAAEKLDFRPDMVLLTVKAQFIHSRFLEPGRVTYGLDGALLVGEAYGDNEERVKEIVSILDKAIKTEIRDNIHGAHWTKLLMNIMGNSPGAMTGLRLGEWGQHSGVRRIVLLMLREALYVVEEAGIKLESLPDSPVLALKTIVKSPLPIASAIFGSMTRSRRNADTIPSMLQSILWGKPTEIDYLNGEFVKLGKKMGVSTPYNAKVVELVREVERTHKFYSPDDLEGIFEEVGK